MKYTDLTFVAHRGYQAQYPENTLVAIDAAYKAGIKHIEFDVQLSSDHKPVLYHDNTLDRTSDMTGFVHHHTLQALTKITAGESGRLGNTFLNETIPSLSDIAKWAKARPDVILYVEIKPEILDHTCVETTVAAVLASLEGVLEQCIVMSFSQDIVSELNTFAQKTSTQVLNTDKQALKTDKQALKTGLVVKNWEEVESGKINRFIKESESLAIIFCNHKIIPNAFDFNAQPIPWVLYETGDIETVEKFSKLGCTHFESYIAPELAMRVD